MPSPPPPSTSTKIAVRPVTSETDVPKLAHLADLALKPDAFHEFRRRYSSRNIYDDCVEKLTESLRDGCGRYFLFKAILAPDPDSEGGGDGGQETIVGFTQWRIGYVETPKMDPFAPNKASAKGQRFETGVSNVTVSEGEEQGEAAGLASHQIGGGGLTESKPFYSDPDAEVSRKLSNSYIGSIRGKRHLCKSVFGVCSGRLVFSFPSLNCPSLLVLARLLILLLVNLDLHRLIVHPSYQRQGIGQKLLDWGVETADRENIVAWLFSRPAGSRLYEKNGWKAILTTEVDTPDDDLHVAPIVSMLRLPRARGG